MPFLSVPGGSFLRGEVPMTESYAPPTVHKVVGSPWRDAVFALLGAPLRPWSAVADVARGDGVLGAVGGSAGLLCDAG